VQARQWRPAVSAHAQHAFFQLHLPSREYRLRAFRQRRRIIHR
jgi:hypothetical protein